MPFVIDPPPRCLSAALCGLSLAGCMTASPAPPPALAAPPAPPVVLAAPTARPEDLATRELLATHDRLRALAPADLQREQARLGDGGADPRAALELALALVQSPSHVPADTARALGLVDGVVRSTAPEAAPWQPIARLLQGRLMDQRRLEDALERQNQQARDAQRRIEQLSDKLEALKAIERSLVTRPSASGPARLPQPGASRARRS